VATYIEDLFQGDTYRIKVQYPLGTDLTGYIHYLTLKSDPNDAVPALQVTAVFGEHTADYPGDAATPPVAYIEATATMTDSVESGKYFYAVKAKAPNADELTLVPKAKDYRDKVFVAPKIPVEG
jgi:hypothetical protein